MSARDRTRNSLLGIWSVGALLFLFIPVFRIVLFSFNDNKGRFNFTWQGFTLDHWKHPFRDPDLAKALVTSLEIAALTAIGAVSAGHLPRRWRCSATASAAAIPPTSPSSCRWRRRRSSGRLAAGDVPRDRCRHGLLDDRDRPHHVHRLLRHRDRQSAAGGELDPFIEEAAQDLGPGVWTTFFKITFPMIAPGVVATGGAGGGDLDRRLRRDELQRRPDADLPAVHLRRHPPGRPAGGQRARDDAAARRARADGPQPAPAESIRIC